jgi:hypothetical protein
MEKRKKVKYYKGKFRPDQPEKYKGNPRNIIYRSMWERRFMVYLDRNENILQWGSEELAIPYKSPLDGKVHRYFPDFYVKVKQYDHTIKEYLVEIKPKNQVTPPKKNPKRKTKSWYFAVKEWGRNQAKWESATHYCQKHDMEFKVLTENDLGLNNPYK